MYKKPKFPRGKLFFPTFIVEDILVIFGFMAIFTTVVFFFPEWIFFGDGEIPADPLNTPEHIKPEWYFLASYQFLKLVPNELGALALQVLAVGAFTFLPFLDRSKESRITQRPVFMTFIIATILFFIGLTLWGAWS